MSLEVRDWVRVLFIPEEWDMGPEINAELAESVGHIFQIEKLSSGDWRLGVRLTNGYWYNHNMVELVPNWQVRHRYELLSFELTDEYVSVYEDDGKFWSSPADAIGLVKTTRETQTRDTPESRWVVNDRESFNELVTLTLMDSGDFDIDASGCNYRGIARKGQSLEGRTWFSGRLQERFVR